MVLNQNYNNGGLHLEHFHHAEIKTAKRVWLKRRSDDCPITTSKQEVLGMTEAAHLYI
jgi:uncharacterized protein YecT (DUF1311 family)